MKRDDCPYLKASAHDGAWEMICTVDNNECNTNWEQYKECNVYNRCRSKNVNI